MITSIYNVRYTPSFTCGFLLEVFSVRYLRQIQGCLHGYVNSVSCLMQVDGYLQRLYSVCHLRQDGGCLQGVYSVCYLRIDGSCLQGVYAVCYLGQDGDCLQGYVSPVSYLRQVGGCLHDVCTLYVT